MCVSGEGGGRFLTSLDGSRYCKALEQSEALALNRIDYCENKFVLPLGKVVDTGKRAERRTPVPHCLVQQFLFVCTIGKHTFSYL